MKAFILAITATAGLSLGAFTGQAEAHHGGYGGYRGSCRSYDRCCSSYCYRPCYNYSCCDTSCCTYPCYSDSCWSGSCYSSNWRSRSWRNSWRGGSRRGRR